MIKFESVYLKRHNREIFSDLNLAIKKNEKVLIQGRSGIGKTTLFKILLGFETIDNGNVTVDGKKITKEHIKEIRHQIFYLSQDVDLKNETVKSLLDELQGHNLLKIQDKARFSELLTLLDLDAAILSQPVKELSGGERQRIGLFIGFLMDRPVWLLDEPTSALDETLKQKITDYIVAQDKTIVIISHDDVWKKNSMIKIERW